MSLAQLSLVHLFSVTAFNGVAAAPEGPRPAPELTPVEVGADASEDLDAARPTELELAHASGETTDAVCDLARDVDRVCDLMAPELAPPLPELDAAEAWEQRWDRGGYLGFGISPGATAQLDWYGGGRGFNPNIRWDTEFGWSWTHPDRAREFRAGVDLHLRQYFGRKTPGGGADVVVSGAVGPVYLRGGVGAMGGVPRSVDVKDFGPAIGGVVGLGLQGHREDLYGRIGVDYDVRVTTDLEVVQSVFLVARLEFNWF